jgi:CRISPR/Cas system-associated exonuclease Cas4 (RecB family)
VDFYGRIDDELCVLDFKTSSGLYLEMPLQLAAYAVAIIEETGERIDTGWIVRLDKKTGKCQPYRIPLTPQTKDAWLRVREAHELVSKIEDQLDGLRKNAA